MPAKDGSDFGGCFGLAESSETDVFFFEEGADIGKDCLYFISRKFARAILIHMDQLAWGNGHTSDGDWDTHRLNGQSTVTCTHLHRRFADVFVAASDRRKRVGTLFLDIEKRGEAEENFSSFRFVYSVPTPLPSAPEGLES